MSLGPAALQVLISRLTGVAEEMGAVLRRAAFSPNIKERADCSAALFTADGEMLVQAEHIPVHLGSMPASVRAAIDAFGDGVGPRDQIVVNDPFAGGTHLNDITLVAPCIVDGRLVGWAANRAHHADVGGAAPGSIPADATDIHQEGLRIPPTLLDDGLRRMLLANSRTPGERVGDLAAQVGRTWWASSGWPRWPAHRSPRWSATASGACGPPSALPDGTWTCRDVLDSTGAAPDLQRPASLAVAVTVAGDEVTFDFTGTDPQSRGNVNAVEAVTVSAVAYAAALGGRSHHPRQRRRHAPRDRGGAAGLAGGRPAARRRGGGQRRGEPAGGRRVPGGAGRAVPRPGARCGPGDDEQPAGRRRRVGLLRDRGRRAGRPPRRRA